MQSDPHDSGFRVPLRGTGKTEWEVLAICLAGRWIGGGSVTGRYSSLAKWLALARGEVEVEMQRVVGIAAGAEDGGEWAAGRSADGGEECVVFLVFRVGASHGNCVA